MKEDIAVGFQEMKTNQNELSLAMKEGITQEFQEMKSNRNGKYYAKSPASTLILGFNKS